jgi:hypothetical protein
MILSDVQILLWSFRSVFSRQKTFVMFVAVILGFLGCATEKHVTQLCMSVRNIGGTKVGRYWSFCKFFSRRQWSVVDLMKSFLTVLLREFSDYRLIVDATPTTTQGRQQQWRHYRRNPHYKKCYDNQSKWLAGNSALSVAFVGIKQTSSGERSWTFPVGAVLLKPGSKAHNERATAVRTIRALELQRSILVADGLYSDAHTVNRLCRLGHVLITKLQSNAVFYGDAACRSKLLWENMPEEVLTVEGRTLHRATQVCYRKKFNRPICAVRERFYDRTRKRYRYIYYCSTDTRMGADEIVKEYKRRTLIEHAHQDAKLLAGFNDCRLRSALSIEGFLCLSLLSVGILEWLRYRIQSSRSMTTKQIIDALGMHWYKPLRLTRGLVGRYAARQLNYTAKYADFWHSQKSAASLIRSFFVT